MVFHDWYEDTYPKVLRVSDEMVIEAATNAADEVNSNGLYQKYRLFAPRYYEVPFIEQYLYRNNVIKEEDKIFKR